MRKRSNGNKPDEPKRVVRAVGYVRCSDEGQSVSDFNTLDNQKNFISQNVAYRGGMDEIPWELVRFYVDDGFSGKDTDRPQLTELLNDVRLGRVDVIVVYKLDRITRSLADFFALDNLFQKHGVALVSVKEQFDTSTPMGKAMRNLLMIFAELERETIAERTRDKMYAEVKQGRWTGGNVPVGYMVVEKKLVPNPLESPVIPIIFEKWAETRSSARVRDHLNILGYRTAVRPCKGGVRGGGDWSIQLIDQIIRNPVYKGTRAYGDMEIPDSHPALVSPEMFDTVNALIPKRSRRIKAAVDHTFILQGLIHCPYCGQRMTPFYVLHNDDHKRPRNYTAYYECQRGHRNPLQPKCPVKRLNAHRLEGALMEDLERLETDPDAMKACLAMVERHDGDEVIQQRLNDVRASLHEVETRIGKLVEALETGTPLPSVTKRLAELEAQARELRGESMLLEAEQRQARQDIPDSEEARAMLHQIREWLVDATGEQKREILSMLVNRIEAIDKKTVQVTYNVPTAPPPDDLGLYLQQGWLPGVDSNHEPSG